VQHQIVDAQHQGLVVGTFEHPDAWRARSQVVWNFQNVSHPVAVSAATFNPGGVDAIEFLPTEACCWIEPNMGQAIGQQRYGLTLLPPAPAVEVMTRWLIPKYRGKRAGGRVVGAQPIPDLAQRFNAAELQSVPTEGIVVRVEYIENTRNTAIEEEFYACRYQFQPVPGAVTQINWGLARVMCVRAERGRLDAAKDTFWRTATSLRLNPQWQALFNQIAQQLHGQFQQVIQAGYDKLQGEQQLQSQMSAYYQQQRDQQSANVAWSVQRQQQMNADRAGGYTAQDAWGDTALSDRTAYEDPNSQAGNYHYEHGQHQWVWTDGQGGWIPTNDPNFDPNVGSSHTWTLAKKVRP
jgi:hypothetical protein